MYNLVKVLTTSRKCLNSTSLPVSFQRTLHKSPNANETVQKLSAFRELSRRVGNGQDCWAWQIQNLAYSINNSVSTTTNEAIVLMKACQRDIVDLFPSEQKLLTEIAWDCVTRCKLSDGSSPAIYNNMILAHTFQEINLNTQTVLDNIKADNLEPDLTIHQHILDHLCKLSTPESALHYKEDNQMELSEQLAYSLIFSHSAAGQIILGENILRTLNEKNIHWSKACYKAFILGSASFGDVEAIEFFLSKLPNWSDDLLLQAIQLMNKKNPDRLEYLLDQLPRNNELFSMQCRRTIRTMLETGNSEAAWNLVMKCKDVAVNNSDKDRVIKISPSIIVLKQFISNCQDLKSILDKIEILRDVDSKIISRAVYVLLETCMDDSEKVPLAKEIIEELQKRSNKKDVDSITNYVGQSSKRRITEASFKSDDEMLRVFEHYCQLGLRIERLRAWDVMLKKLIPDFPDKGDWSVKTLEDRCFIAKKLIHSKSNEMYSDSVIWAAIMQTLLNRENPLFFSTAARLAQTLNFVSGPRRWHLSLANCLLRLRDAKAFADIVEVCYWNCEKRDSWSDYSLVAGSLTAAIVKAQKVGVNIDGLLGDVLDEFWRRGIKLPSEVREDIIGKLDDAGHRNMFENVPVLGSKVFKHRTRRGIV